MENNEWLIKKSYFNKEENKINESLFTLGNGYLGIRGSFDEYDSEIADFTTEGNFINGYYEIEDIIYHESAVGYATQNQIMVNLCNPKRLHMIADGEKFHFANTENFERVLNMKDSVLQTKYLWKLTNGKKISVSSNRTVSQTNRNLLAIEYNFTAVDDDISISLTNEIDGNERIKDETGDPRLRSRSSIYSMVYNTSQVKNVKDNNIILELSGETKNSKSKLSCLVGIKETSNIKSTITTNTENKSVQAKYDLTLNKGETYSFTKYILFYTNRDESLIEKSEIQYNTMENVMNDSFEDIRNSQNEYMNDFWNKSNISILKNDDLTSSLRFSVFGLLQSTGRDGVTSVAAKGLTGEGYGGHYFWESETYILPAFLLNKPEVAKSLLEYRYSILNNAREQAKKLGFTKGALYSWRSINGEECSAYYPAGSAQYHINADVSYALKLYLQCTNDYSFIDNYGAEIIFETARIWIETGHYQNNQFKIDCITGPDEYTAIVNNNNYTNFMASEHLKFAVSVYNDMQKRNPEKLEELSLKINLHKEEIKDFNEAAEKMYYPYDENLGIYKQDDSFLDKKKIDINKLTKPLLRNYHPLFIYKHQLCKQPDTLLAELLLWERFTKEQVARDFKYYFPITTHDSSLSAAIFSILASYIGDKESAYEMFIESVKLDLEDKKGNTKDGLHMANQAGAYMTVVYGFAGYRIGDKGLHFSPIKIDEIDGYSFTITYKGTTLEIECKGDYVTYKFISGEEISFYHNNEEIQLSKEVTQLKKSIC